MMDDTDPDSSAEATERGDLEAARKLRAARAAEAQERRQARSAQKLRENLQRRKLQQRARRQGEASEEEGLPAANSTNETE